MGCPLRLAYCPCSRQSPSGFSCFASRSCGRGGCLPTPGHGVRFRARLSLFRIRPVLPYQPIFQHFIHHDAIIEDSFFHPSGLRLARSLPMASSRLGLSFLLCTTPLLASHKESDDRLGHCSKSYDCSFHATYASHSLLECYPKR